MLIVLQRKRFSKTPHPTREKHMFSFSDGHENGLPFHVRMSCRCPSAYLLPHIVYSFFIDLIVVELSYVRYTCRDLQMPK